jgi:excisionase family DNA binding protein
MKSDLMTIKEVASYLKIPEKTAYTLAAQGTIPGFKIGRAWRFSKSTMDEWIKKAGKNNK